MKKLFSFLLTGLLLLFFNRVVWGQTTVFNENVGTPSGTTAITSYTGWQNNGVLTFTGDADVRTSTASTGYTGASGSGNVFITNTNGKYLEISGINTSQYSSIALSFGHYKSTTTSNNELVVEVSSNGTDYTSLTYSRATGSGTASWILVTPTGTIPSTSNLRIKFRQTSTAAQFRIDDIKLTGTIPEPTTQATNITFGPVGTNSFTINWTNGDGSSRAVFMKQGSGAITNPSDGTAYTASADWNSKGTQLGSSGYYCVYNGSGSSVAVTNLLPNTAYYIQVFEYNSSGVTSNYNTATATNNPNNQTTSAASEPTLTIAADPALTELNLDAGVITLTLTNDEFVDGTLDEANFILNNAPAGVTIESIEYATATSATLNLAYDGTDFDANVTNFSVTIGAGELTSSTELTSNSLTITATVETVPVVTTDAAITTNGTSTATWGGEVTSDGGEPVTQKGLVWNTSATPTIANFKTEEGAGTGAITGNMTGLTPNTLYYLRAYAINSVGTSYGDEETFTTNNLSAPTASAATQISSTGFTANWNSVSDAASYRLDVSTIETFGSEDALLDDGFENSSAMGKTGGSYYSGNSAVGDAPASSPFYLSGSYAIGVSAGTLTLISENINAADYASITLEFRLASFSVNSSGNGADAGDNVTIEVSPNGGIDYYSTIRVKGNSNAQWSYTSGTGIATTAYDGDVNLVEFAPSGGGARTTDGYSTVRVTNLPNSNTLKIRITCLNDNANERWLIDDLLLSGTLNSYVTGYNDATINTTSETITGLTAGTTYYYRVRAFSATSTSDNSSTITVTTAASTQTNPVVGTGSQNVTVSGTTGVGNINFANVTTPGDILVSNFNNAPVSHGLDGNVSNYRWVIESGSGLVFNQGEGYTLRFEVADCPGITELLDGNNTDLQLYKRSTPGSGAFAGPIALTYHRNGTDGNQADDYITSELIITGFSEFVFQSPSQPLPVELSSFSALPKANGVQLTWTTATEINNFGFEVERSQKPVVSSENSTWQEIGFVKGNGNSNSPREYSYTDNTLSNSGKFVYRLKQIDNDGTVTYSNEIETDVTVVLEYGLSQNYPNPFNPATVINYTLAEPGFVTIKVYNMLGEEVTTLINGQMEAGKHTLQFDGHNLSSGMYLYKITAGNFTQVKKMLLTK